MLALCNFFFKNRTKTHFKRAFTKEKKGAKNRNFFTIICVGFNVLHHIIIDITPITCKNHYIYVWYVALRTEIYPFIDFLNLIFTKHDKIYL